MTASVLSSTTLHSLLADCAHALTASAQNEKTRAAAATVNALIDTGSNSLQTLRYAPSTVPLTRVVDSLDDSDLVRNHRRTLKQLPWTPSHRSDDGGREMALCNLNNVVKLGPVRLGFVLVAAGCAYPEHEHPPQEAYLVVSGTGLWRFGGQTHYEPVAPGHSLYNHSMDRHGIQAQDSPIFALYVLWPSSTDSPAT